MVGREVSSCECLVGRWGVLLCECVLGRFWFPIMNVHWEGAGSLLWMYYIAGSWGFPTMNVLYCRKVRFPSMNVLYCRKVRIPYYECNILQEVRFPTMNVLYCRKVRVPYYECIVLQEGEGSVLWMHCIAGRWGFRTINVLYYRKVRVPYYKCIVGRWGFPNMNKIGRWGFSTTIVE